MLPGFRCQSSRHVLVTPLCIRACMSTPYQLCRDDRLTSFTDGVLCICKPAFRKAKSRKAALLSIVEARKGFEKIKLLDKRHCMSGVSGNAEDYEVFWCLDAWHTLYHA